MIVNRKNPLRAALQVKTVALSVLVILAPILLAPAFSQSSDLISVVADGKPWAIKQSDGKTGQVTLSKDGTAQMQIETMRASPTWRKADNGQLCVKPALVIPERCSTLKKEGAAIVGSSDGKEQFRLTR
jgi:hypothetical protein